MVRTVSIRYIFLLPNNNRSVRTFIRLRLNADYVDVNVLIFVRRWLLYVNVVQRDESSGSMTALEDRAVVGDTYPTINDPVSALTTWFVTSSTVC